LIGSAEVTVAEIAYRLPFAGPHLECPPKSESYLCDEVETGMAERGLLVASNNFLAASMSSGKTKSKQDIPGILSCSTPTRSQKYLPANAIRPLSSISTEPASEKGMAAVPLSWMGTKKLYRHDLIRAIQMDRLPTNQKSR